MRMSASGEDRVEGGGELAVPVADHESELGGVVAEVHQEVAGLLGDPGAGGVGGDRGEVHAAAAVLDHDQEVVAVQEDGVDVGEVDGEDRVGLRGQELSPGRPDRRGAGSRPAFLRMVQTVDAAIRWPSPTSSPWRRRYPHRGFSRAIRNTSARTVGDVVGRPGCRCG